MKEKFLDWASELFKKSMEDPATAASFALLGGIVVMGFVILIVIVRAI